MYYVLIIFKNMAMQFRPIFHFHFVGEVVLHQKGQGRGKKKKGRGDEVKYDVFGIL
jgi:hypothetical protein